MSSLEEIAHQILGESAGAEACLAHGRRVWDALGLALRQEGSSDLAVEHATELQVGAYLHGVFESQCRRPGAGSASSPAETVAAAPLGETVNRRLAAEILECCNATARLFPEGNSGNSRADARSETRPVVVQQLAELLSEIDSVVHLEEQEVDEAIDTWRRCGLPLAAAGIGSATPWAWGVSLIGNLRLTARCALLNARTQDGWESAKRGHARIENLIEAMCVQEGVLYQQDLCDPVRLLGGPPAKTRCDSFAQPIWVERFYGWEELEERIRAVPLMYARDVHPYETARARLAVVARSEVTPIAHYVLTERIRAMEQLNEALTRNLCMCIWDLPGLAELGQVSGEPMLICPPVTECHPRGIMNRTRLSGDGEERVLIDGLHRAYLAARLQQQHMRVIEISGVSFPPIAFSTTWGAITEHSTPPRRDAERRWYRYEKYSDYRAGPFSRVIPATRDSFQYALYRDLSRLGSPGSRLHAQRSK